MRLFRDFKVLILVLTICLFSTTASAQSTLVSATMVDNQGITWQNATVSFVFVPTPGVPGPYVWSGGSFNPQPNPILSDGSGSWSQTLPSNTSITPVGSTWMISIAPDATAPACIFNLQITTSAMDLSTLFTQNCQVKIVQSQAFPRAYADIEVATPPVFGQIYFNTTTMRHRTFTNAGWVDMISGGSGNVVGATNRVGSFSNGNTTKATNGTVDTPGNQFNFPVTNNIVLNVCMYPGTTLADKIVAADTDSVYANRQAILEVNNQCSNMSISNTRVPISPGHILKFGPGLTVEMTNASIQLAGLFTGVIGDSSTNVNLHPGSCTGPSGFLIDNVIPGPTPIEVGFAQISGFNINANANEFIAVSCTQLFDRPVQVTDNSSAAIAAHDVTISGLKITNCGVDCILIGGANGSNHHAQNIYVLDNSFDTIYDHAIRWQPTIINGVTQNNKAVNYEIPFTFTGATLTATGTTATVHLLAPGFPGVIDTSNVPTLIVTGCADAQYNKPYTVNSQPIVTVPISTGALSFDYQIPAGAPASTTGCTVTMANSQAPFRADADISNPTIGLVFDHNTLSNTARAREFGIEAFAGAPGNFPAYVGLQVTNNTFDAQGFDGGTGLSMGGVNSVVSGNKLVHGVSGQISNGCECSFGNSTISNENYEGGQLAVNGGFNNSVSNITASGTRTGGDAVGINDTGSTFSNISVDLGPGSSTTFGIAFGVSGGPTSSTGNTLNGFTVTQHDHVGAPVGCILLGGTAGSGNNTISNGTCNFTDYGIEADGSSNMDVVTISNVNTSTVVTQSYALGPVQHVIISNALHSATQIDAQDFTARSVYGQLTVLPLTQLDSGTILNIGAGGSTSYSYVCVGKRGTAILTTPTLGPVSAPSSLSPSGFLFIICPTFRGATSTDIYRTVGGATQGKIATATNPAGGIFDQGLVGDGSSPPATANKAVFTIDTTDITGLDGSSINVDGNNKLETIGLTGTATGPCTVNKGLIVSCP